MTDDLIRPYDTTMIAKIYESGTWDQVLPQYVTAESLIPTHDSISSKRLLELARYPHRVEGGDLLPHIIKHNGEYYIHDGHHRVTLFRLFNRGAVMRARVVNEAGSSIIPVYRTGG